MQTAIQAAGDCGPDNNQETTKVTQAFPRTDPVPAGKPATALTGADKKLIFAASVGTAFEWYDFYLYGALASSIGRHFFSNLDEGSQMIFALLAFSAGFVMRPFGALVFGRLGDMVGRKYTFLVTILCMGFSTFAVGVIPTYASIGIVAPIILISLRLIQGLAVGGEYGGAATYLAEHAPPGRRGAFTSWLQTTTTLGLTLSLLVILGLRYALGDAAFNDYGWRIPFLVSIIPLGISVWVRLAMHESPTFLKMKNEGRLSKAPLKESFTVWKNLKIVLIALFGVVLGQALVGVTGQVYTLFFLTGALKVDPATANILISIALLLGTPFFVVFGTLSDKIGRKPVIMGGILIATLTIFPLFKALTFATNPAMASAQANAHVVVAVAPAECSFQFNPTGTRKFTSSCDVAKQALAAEGVSYDIVETTGGATISVGDQKIASYSSTGLSTAEAHQKAAAFKQALDAELTRAGYPTRADPARMNKPLIIAILTLLVIYVTMVYGPIAAMLVEMFPTRIRYTSMSLPYHVGNILGSGLAPAAALAVVAQTGNMYDGLWYPVLGSGVVFIIGMVLVRETKDVDISADD
jgi:MFS family permease